MKIKKIKKLNVSRETVRNLDEASLGAVGGGTYGSATSGTGFGGGCCAGCGCVRTQVVCEGGGTAQCEPAHQD